MFSFARNLLTKARNNIVLEDWVLTLPMKEQCSLLSVVRGNDKDNGTCEYSKRVTKMLRYLILRNVGKKYTYMSEDVIKRNTVINTLYNQYPTNKHFVDHVMQAGFLVASDHPNNYIREYWGNVSSALYSKIKSYKRKERKIQRIYDKYIDIYTRRGM